MGTSIVWCHSPTLCGSTCWGRPSVDDVAATTAVFDRGAESLAPHFDLVLDGRSIEAVGMPAFEAFVAWVRGARRLRSRVRRQIGVVALGPVGYMLAGISPLLRNDTRAIRLFTNAREAYTFADDAAGPQLLTQVEAAFEQESGLGKDLRALRDVLHRSFGNLTIEQAAKQIGTSGRTLQRTLRRSDRSFRTEQLDARFTAACNLLTTTDHKLGHVARTLGVSERTLTALFRARTGQTPAEFRGARLPSNGAI